MSDVDDPLVGARIGSDYRIVAKLGGGAVGTVYRAKQPGGAPAAVKVLHAEYAQNDEARKRFEREATALSALRHPNIIGVLEFGTHEDALYLVMELGEGETLDAFIERGAPDPTLALLLADQTLAGLAYAHAHGILHRDLKSENVLVTHGTAGAPVARLLDFGLARFADRTTWGETSTLTAEGTVMGTPAYMPPEQALGARVDARADVYSAGVVLFELLTGEWPYYADDVAGMIRAHAMSPVPKIAETRPELRVEPGLQAVLEKAMAKKPSDRFDDARAMRTALQAVKRPAASLR